MPERLLWGGREEISDLARSRSSTRFVSNQCFIRHPDVRCRTNATDMFHRVQLVHLARAQAGHSRCLRLRLRGLLHALRCAAPELARGCVLPFSGLTRTFNQPSLTWLHSTSTFSSSLTSRGGSSWLRTARRCAGCVTERGVAAGSIIRSNSVVQMPALNWWHSMLIAAFSAI